MQKVDRKFPFPFPRDSKSTCILNKRCVAAVRLKALTVAAYCTMLGDVKRGHRIIDLLYKHNNFDYDEVPRYLWLAWGASQSWPSPYANWRHLPSPGGWIKWKEVVGKPKGTELNFEDFTNARKKASDREPGAQVASLEIALELGLDDVAGELIRRHLVMPVYGDDTALTVISLRRVPILASPALWKLLIDGWLRKELGVTHRRIERYVDKFVRLLDERLREGAMAGVRGKSVEELCRIFSEQGLVKKRLGNSGVPIKFSKNGPIPDNGEIAMPSTVLRPPASPSAIADLEKEAQNHGFHNGLPEDYKTFLRTSDGIKADTCEGKVTDIFRSISDVEFRSMPYTPFLLLPNDAIPSSCHVSISWSQTGDEKLLDIGCARGEGVLQLLPGAMFQRSLEAFDEAYENASDKDKRALERAAEDVFGSIEQMRRLDCVRVRFHHWNCGWQLFKDFRSYHEFIVAERVDVPSEDTDDEANERSGSEEHDAEIDDGDEGDCEEGKSTMTKAKLAEAYVGATMMEFNRRRRNRVTNI